MEAFCPYCARTTRLIYVHGHGQCEICKINLEPCCQGRNTTEAAAHPGGGFLESDNDRP